MIAFIRKLINTNIELKKNFFLSKVNSNFQSKIDDCSLKRIGEMPFKITANLKCIGVPGSSESSDKILLIDSIGRPDSCGRIMLSYKYVFSLT